MCTYLLIILIQIINCLLFFERGECRGKKTAKSYVVFKSFLMLLYVQHNSAAVQNSKKIVKNEWYYTELCVELRN